MYQVSLKCPETAKKKNVTRDQIQQTESFKEQSKMLQNIILGKTNVQAIQNGVNISLNKGFEYWDQITKARWQNKKIVEEILNTID